MNNLKFISCTDPNISYMGRIDFSDPDNPMLIYSGSTVRFRFTGCKLSVVIESFSFKQDIWIGYFLDGKEQTLTIPGDLVEDYDNPSGDRDIKFKKTRKTTFDIPVTQNLDIHSFILFKRMNGVHVLTINGFYIEKGAYVTDAGPLPKRKIECYGDSVCCGEVCEALDYLQNVDPLDNNGKFDNSWYGFPAIVSRLLNAQLNNISQGGLAVLNNTGYCFPPYFPGLESTYSKLHYMSYFRQSQWDFSSYTPDIVIFALGQNDPHNEGHPDNDIDDCVYREKWKKAYTNILEDLLKKYSDAHFIFVTTVLMHERKLDDAIDEIVSEENLSRVHRFYFRRNGCATPGHPRIPEQEEMAAELAEYINSLGPGIWSDES